jgi:hypothetical protein
MNNWVHYVKNESTKHNNNSVNSVQGKNTALLVIRVLFCTLECNREYGAKVQRRYHARLRKKSLWQTIEIPDTNAGIVSKLKEAMSKCREYNKVETEEDIDT